MRYLGLAALIPGLFSCAYLLPAAWQDYRVPPAVLRAAVTASIEASDLDSMGWAEQETKLTTGWLRINDGVSETRERYVIRFERDDEAGTLTVFVRHEAQERASSVGEAWSVATHDRDKERALLAHVTAEVERRAKSSGRGDPATLDERSADPARPRASSNDEPIRRDP